MSNRNKSLARLATWAAGNNGPDAFLYLRDAIDAHTYGAKAVRAIRETVPGECLQADPYRCIRFTKPHGVAYTEARLAARAALAACGIRGAL